MHQQTKKNRRCESVMSVENNDIELCHCLVRDVWMTTSIESEIVAFEKRIFVIMNIHRDPVTKTSLIFSKN